MTALGKVLRDRGRSHVTGFTRRPAARVVYLNWVWWYNHTRLHGEIGHVPPVEYETNHYRHNNPRQQPLPGEPALH